MCTQHSTTTVMSSQLDPTYTIALYTVRHTIKESLARIIYNIEGAKLLKTKLMSFKKCKVVMLPTNEKAIEGQLILSPKKHLGLNIVNRVSLGNKYFDVANAQWKSYHDENGINLKSQHLYITSDEEIKENSLVLLPNNTIHRMNALDMISYLDSQSKATKLIIATTQPFMNLPQPSQQFIEKYIEEYNKGNVITDVLVEYKNIFDKKINIIDECSIIPNNHFKLKVNPKDNTITIKKVKDSWNREEHIQDIKRIILLEREYQDLTHHFIDTIDLDKFITDNL